MFRFFLRLLKRTLLRPSIVVISVHGSKNCFRAFHCPSLLQSNEASVNIGRIRSFGFCCCFVSLLLSGCSFTERVTTGLLLPGGYSEGVALREFLRSSDWKAYRSEVPDSIAMNMIYGLACSLCDGNTEHALLATSVAVLEHRTIPVGL